MKDRREATDRGGREVIDRGAQPGARPPNRPLTRPCSSCVPGNSRSFATIRDGSARAAATPAGNRSQRQLQQLELTADENRYEEQRTARAQQEQSSQREREQGETRQVLNRLRELAQRQTDLNERLKELQSALEAAKTQPGAPGDRAAAQAAPGSAATDPARCRRAERADGARGESRPDGRGPRSRWSRAASTSVRPPRHSRQGRLPQALTEGDPRRPAVERPARGASQGRLEPVLRGNDRDARPGAAAGRRPGEALRTARRREPAAAALAARHGGAQAGRARVSSSKRRSSISSSSRCAARCKTRKRPSRSWPRGCTTRSERRPSKRSPMRSRSPSSSSIWALPRMPPRHRGTPARASSSCGRGSNARPGACWATRPPP